jgi:hypothetical protein
MRAQGVHEQQQHANLLVCLDARASMRCRRIDAAISCVADGVRVWCAECPTNKHVACGTGLHSAAPQLPGFVLLVHLVHIRSRTTTNGIVRMPCFESSSKSGSTVVGGHDRTSTNYTVRTFWFDGGSCNHSSKTAALASERQCDGSNALVRAASSQTPGVCARCGSASWA